MAKGTCTEWLKEIDTVPATLAIYESPKRINRLLDEMVR